MWDIPVCGEYKLVQNNRQSHTIKQDTVIY